MPTPTYIPLQTITLGSAASSVTFASIPQTYRDLVLVVIGRSSYTINGDDNIEVRFNSDSGSNYSRVLALGNTNGTDSNAAGSTRAEFGVFPTSASSNTSFGQVIGNIMDYSATDKHKTILARGNSVPNSSVNMNAARWASTLAITSIEVQTARNLQGASADLVVGTTLSLYGIEA